MNNSIKFNFFKTIFSIFKIFIKNKSIKRKFLQVGTLGKIVINRLDVLIMVWNLKRLKKQRNGQYRHQKSLKFYIGQRKTAGKDPITGEKLKWEYVNNN